MLANYKKNALDRADWVGEEREKNEFRLDSYLYPIISELVGLSQSDLMTEDLHAFFIWKSNVDDRRNSLVELGFLTIDAMIHSNESVLTVKIGEDEEIVLEEPFSKLVQTQLEKSSIDMSFLSSLEDRVSDIFRRIDNACLQDKDSLKEIKQLLEYLKVDAERFQQISDHTKQVLDSFNSIKQAIQQAESRLAGLHKSIYE